MIAQAPNLALLIFLCALAVGLFAKPSGVAETIVRVIEVGSLATWALDELVRGVNPWRRMLGAGTCVYILTAWFLR